MGYLKIRVLKLLNIYGPCDLFRNCWENCLEFVVDYWEEVFEIYGILFFFNPQGSSSDLVHLHQRNLSVGLTDAFLPKRIPVVFIHIHLHLICYGCYIICWVG